MLDSENKHTNQINMNKNNLVQEREIMGERLLKRFNKLTMWFKEIHNNNNDDTHSIIDFRCIDQENHECHVEIKTRKGKMDTYDDIFVDATKLKEWADISKEDCKRYYFNFMDDGLLIFDLDKISEMKVYPKHKQVNYAKGYQETRDKYGLYTKDATKYKYSTKEKGLIKL